MAVGLTIYAFGRKNLPEKANTVPNPLPHASWVRVMVAGAVVVALIVITSATGLLTADRLSGTVVAVTIIVAIAYFVGILANRRITPVERKRVVAFVPMFLVNAVFWSLY